jgi:hypothetical protein
MTQKELLEAIDVQLTLAEMLAGSDFRRSIEITTRLLALYHLQQPIPATSLDY